MRKLLSILLSFIFTFSSSNAFALSKSDIQTQIKNNAKTMESQILQSIASTSTYSEYRGLELDSWAVKEVSIANQLGIMPSTVSDYFHEPITRRNFAILAIANIVKMSGVSTADLNQLVTKSNYFSDCDDFEVAACNALGIVTGDTNGKFNPDNTITRQEAAAMLSRIAALAGYSPKDAPLSFNDISGLWGSADISKVSSMTTPFMQNQNGNLRVMGGIGNGQFAPHDYYSRQEAVATMVRIFGAIVSSYSGYKSTATPATPAPTSNTFVLPKDKTTFNPHGWTWELTGYDAQDIDDINFRNGKYVREDGKSVLYIDHSSSPDYFEFWLHMEDEAGHFMDQYNDDTEVISNTYAKSTSSSLEFTAGKKNNINTITVKTYNKDEYFQDDFNNDGLYYLERAKNVNFGS